MVICHFVRGFSLRSREREKRKFLKNRLAQKSGKGEGNRARDEACEEAEAVKFEIESSKKQQQNQKCITAKASRKLSQTKFPTNSADL